MERAVFSDARNACTGCPNRCAERQAAAPALIALAGNPNCGKTTLFNALTGAHEPVGNRAGVTVEQKQKRLTIGGQSVMLTDLPGVYALSSATAEERAAAAFLTKERPALVINIVDATRLERQLYLTCQLLERGVPVVLALNMTDELEKRGMRLDAGVLRRRLGIPAVPISARTGDGLDALVACCRTLLETGSRQSRLPVSTPEGRYRRIAALTAEALGADQSKRPRGEKVDRILTHPLFGIPIYLAVMGLIFLLTFGSLGAWLSDGMEHLLSDMLAPLAAAGLLHAGVSPLLCGFVSEGVFGALGSVLTFLPQIALLYVFLSLLEDSGYMARAAYLSDRIFRGIGLSGKSGIPLLLAFGCTVPAALSVRTLPEGEVRRNTLRLLPFVSCSAKLPVYGLLAAAFFPNARGLAVLSLYILGILVGVIYVKLTAKTGACGERELFLLELPPYRLPLWRNVLEMTALRVGHFLLRAGTVLFALNVGLYVLLHLTPALAITQDAGASLLAGIGRTVAPLLRPLGFGSWQASLALLTGFAAKEAVAASLVLLAGGADAAAALFTPLSAYGFLVFVLLCPPCMAALAAMRREYGGRMVAARAFAAQLALAYSAALLLHLIGSILG